jgi:RNA polymerase sigma-70 factor (ECF subfamily)
MSSAEQPPDPREEPAFAALVASHRGELQVHCYRMLGSLEDAEDLVQETFLRAWRGRERFGAGGRLLFRACSTGSRRTHVSTCFALGRGG